MLFEWKVMLFCNENSEVSIVKDTKLFFFDKTESYEISVVCDHNGL